MRYLRPFNESLSYQEELQEFCESNLAYLMDEGMDVSIHRYVVSEKLSVVLSFGKGNKNTGGMKWDDIKDYIIPFLIRLKREYQVLPYQEEKNDDELQFKVEITSLRFDFLTCKIDDVIKSNINFLFKKARLQLYDINYLAFYVKEK